MLCATAHVRSCTCVFVRVCTTEVTLEQISIQERFRDAEAVAFSEGFSDREDIQSLDKCRKTVKFRLRNAGVGMYAPWNLHPDLTEERLVAVAQLIASGRDAALEIYDPDRGFNGWLLGCCAYQFGRHRIERAVDEAAFSWLSLARGTRHFIFQIGSAPVRFYRDDPDDPSDKVLRQSGFEAQQLSLSLGDEMAEGMSFRLVVETGMDGELIRIVFLGLRSGTTILFWEVPLQDALHAPLVQMGAAPLDEGVALPPPAVAVKRRNPGTATSGG